MKPPKNMGVSIRVRLTQRARERRENAQLLMTRYAIERVLYRLSISPHRNRFVLKGAMLFSLWAPVPYRATGDLDLLGFGENDPDAVAAVFGEILALPVDDDDGSTAGPYAPPFCRRPWAGGCGPSGFDRRRSRR